VYGMDTCPGYRVRFYRRTGGLAKRLGGTNLGILPGNVSARERGRPTPVSPILPDR